jgi:hypothetical protein
MSVSNRRVSFSIYFFRSDFALYQQAYFRVILNTQHISNKNNMNVVTRLHRLNIKPNGRAAHWVNHTLRGPGRMGRLKNYGDINSIP